MIWLPVLAIIVFFIFLISSIIIGYKVGWRASLFISVLFFAITFISIMICLLIYKKTLWPFYQKLFLNRLFDKSVTFSSEGSGQYSIDPLIFEEKYKSRAILIFSLMFTPLTFIIVFFSYFLLRKRINNYMRPKVTQTEINVKVINSKPKVFRSRMIGMGILGLSFLFVSSYLASGIAAASIKKDKRSFLNNITDSLTKAYSFSLASNESESRDIDQVISYIDKDFFDNTRKIWTTTNFESWDLARAQNIKNYLENSELIKEMKKLQDKDAIANALMRPLSGPWGGSSGLLMLGCPFAHLTLRLTISGPKEGLQGPGGWSLITKRSNSGFLIFWCLNGPLNQPWSITQ